MPLNLHPKCIKILKQGLEDGFDQVTVKRNMFIDRESLVDIFLLDKALPSSGPVHEILNSIISEHPLFDFIYGYLSKELFEKDEHDRDKDNKNLTSIAEYSDKEKVANKLIEEFSSLPWKFSFSVPLSKEISDHISENVLNITENIRLIKPTEEFQKLYPLVSGIKGRDDHIGDQQGGLLSGLLSQKTPAEWNSEIAYLQIDISGFMGLWISSNTLEKFNSDCKSILGLLIAMRTFEVNNRYTSNIMRKNAYLHRLYDESWEIYDKIDIDEGISKTMSMLGVDDLNGRLDSKERKILLLKQNVEKISKALKHKEITERLTLSGMWLFDSYCGSNELLSFVQTTVAIEILLGDKNVSDLMGLGELLRNRCAYLIGKTHKQRENILSDFKKIYDVRSKIVHRGKAKLTTDERELFRKLQWITNRVIQEEIELIGKNT